MSDDRKTLNVCLIGQKFMGRAHSNAFAQVARFFRGLPAHYRLHTVVGRDAGALGTFGRQWGWERAVTDWREAVADPEIDVVDVATPNHVHDEMAIAALEAGKHVLCEKPLAHTLDAARAMRDAAAEARGRTFVWYNYRRCPAVALAHQLVKSGAVGRIYHVRGFYLQDWAGPDAPLVWRFQGDVAGSGSLGDLCAHSIDTARFITGLEFEAVAGAHLKTFIEERPLPEDAGGGGEISGKGSKVSGRTGRSTVDDAVIFTATLSTGALATFEATRLSTGHKNGNRIEIHGDRGALIWDFEKMTELRYYDATDDARTQGWRTIQVSDAGAGHPYAAAYWPTAHHIGYEHSFVNQAADVAAVLGGGEAVVPLPDFADAYETQRVLEAVTRSARDHGPVRLADVR